MKACLPGPVALNTAKREAEPKQEEHETEKRHTRTIYAPDSDGTVTTLRGAQLARLEPRIDGRSNGFPALVDLIVREPVVLVVVLEWVCRYFGSMAEAGLVTRER